AANLPCRARADRTGSRRDACDPRERAVGLCARPVSEEAGTRRRDRCEDAPRSDRCDAQGSAGLEPRTAEEDRPSVGTARRRSRRNTRHAVDRREEGDAEGPCRAAATRERRARGRVLDLARAKETCREEEDEEGDGGPQEKI